MRLGCVCACVAGCVRACVREYKCRGPTKLLLEYSQVNTTEKNRMLLHFGTGAFVRVQFQVHFQVKQSAFALKFPETLHAEC